MSIVENYTKIKTLITKEANKQLQESKPVHLIAVSKTRPVEDILQVYTAGQLDFGENKPQEIRDKAPLCPKEIRWHMIGHLQSNKIKYVLEHRCLIHSVDTLKLAQEINLQAEKKGIIADILLQVDLAKDGRKQGFRENELEDILTEISRLQCIRVHGLMTIAPFVSDPEENRPIFRKLRQISVDIPVKNHHNIDMSVLSMGMSNDYLVAIQEGATHVRIGTAIFGERNYDKEMKDGKNS